MSWLDTLIITIVVASIAYSLWRGLVRELISFGSLVLAAILATRYCQWGAEHLTETLGSERAATFLGFFLIFVGVLACGILVGRISKGFLKKAGLSPMDKLLGALLGLLKASMLIAVILMLMGNFIPNGQEIIEESRTAHIFMPVADRLADFLPTSLLDKFLKDVKRGMNTIKKYRGRLEKEGGKLQERYQPDVDKLLPRALKENLESGKEALEEDREKLRKLFRENL